MMLSLRSTIAKVHLWLGLTVGLVGVYMAATGGWILFRPQADALLDPGHLTVQPNCVRPTSLDKVATAAVKVHPQAAIDSLWWKADRSASLMVRYVDNAQAYFDPCDAGLIGIGSRWSGPFGFIEKLHRFRFLPNPVAEPLAGAFAVVMAFAMGGLGLYLWWPRRVAAWKQALRFDPRLRGRARTRNRHSVVGAIAAVGLILIAGSGIALAFESVENLIFAVTATSRIAKPDAEELEPGQPLALQAAWSNALVRMSAQPRAASLRFPTADRKSIEMYLYDRDNPNVEGRSYLYADARTGEVLKYVPYAQTPLGQRAYSWLVSLHEGEVGGPLGQLLTFAVMLAIIYLGYSGVRGYLQKRFPAGAPVRLRVAAVRDVARDVRELEFEPLRGGRLRRPTPGAHIEVRLPDGIRRQYSLCNGPEDRKRYVIAVRREENSRGGSTAMHGLEIGQELMVGGPRNHFPLERSTRRAVLIAAGIGITPILSMARHLAAHGTPFSLHYFGRDAAGMAYREVIGTLTRDTRIHVGLSRPEIQSNLAEVLSDQSAGMHVYTCGPDAFMAEVETRAVAAGWPARRVHRENFASSASQFAGPREPIDVVLARSGRKIRVDREETVLCALRGAGLTVSSSCEQGTCGDCAIAVREGDIDHRDNYLSDGQRARGDVMLCCISRAKGSCLVLDL